MPELPPEKTFERNPTEVGILQQQDLDSFLTLFAEHDKEQVQRYCTPEQVARLSPRLTQSIEEMRQNLPQLIERMQNPSFLNRFYVARTNGRVIGFINVLKAGTTGKGVVWPENRVQLLYVHPKHRNLATVALLLMQVDQFFDGKPFVFYVDPQDQKLKKLYDLISKRTGASIVDLNETMPQTFLQGVEGAPAVTVRKFQYTPKTEK